MYKIAAKFNVLSKFIVGTTWVNTLQEVLTDPQLIVCEEMIANDQSEFSVPRTTEIVLTDSYVQTSQEFPAGC